MKYWHEARTYAYALLFFVFVAFIATFFIPFSHTTRGIYLTQLTASNKTLLQKIIKEAKRAGINTFVVDVDHPSKSYTENIPLLKANHIQYVARIVLFPDGAYEEQVTDPNYWNERYQLVQYAVNLGANAIQLDYVRYKPSQPASLENAQNINQVIAWFHRRLVKQNVPLQVAVFGETSYKPSDHIGQDVKLFSKNLDALAPMLYPSHFEPYEYYSSQPYQTIYKSLEALREQFAGNVPVKVYAYIEVANYHYPNMDGNERVRYISAEIKAAQDAKVDGWYAWSANNRYTYLFEAAKQV